MTISKRIFEELKKQKKKQKELAEYTGISESAVSDWKKKGTNPAAENLYVIADFLNVSVNYLLTGEEKLETSTGKEQEMLNLFRRLPNDEQAKLIGRTELLVEMNANKSTDS